MGLERRNRDHRVRHLLDTVKDELEKVATDVLNPNQRKNIQFPVIIKTRKKPLNPPN